MSVPAVSTPAPRVAPLPAPIRARNPGPKLLICLQDYSLATLTADVAAGITVGLVALPLVLAFAIASGVPPEWGLSCAIVTGLLISALGGSRVQIGGPSGAFVVLAGGIVAQHGAGGLFVCTMMAGVLLVVLGATGIGTAIRFLPRPVIVGFTNGIAVVIASTQIKDFFGLSLAQMPGDFASRAVALVTSVHTIAWPATLLAGATLALLIAWSRRPTWIPGVVVALFAATLLVRVFNFPVDIIESRFQAVAGGLPQLQIPDVHAGMLATLLLPAFTIALLGSIQSIMSATSGDRLSGDRHNPNVELVAHGVANMASPLFGGLPAAGALFRTLTNIRAGARTPVSGIVHALVLFVVLLAVAPLVGWIPMAVLAAIVLVVAWNTSNWQEIPDVVRMGRTEAGVWLVTLLLTVFADLTVAIPVGTAIGALLFIRRVATTTAAAQVIDELDARAQPNLPAVEKPIPTYVSVFRVSGPLLYGSTDALDVVLDQLDALAPIVILRLRDTTAIDATGLQAVADLAAAVSRSNRIFLVSEARAQVDAFMRRAAFERRLGPGNVSTTFDAALVRARELNDLRFSGAWPRIE